MKPLRFSGYVERNVPCDSCTTAYSMTIIILKPNNMNSAIIGVAGILSWNKA